jgi:hypothetical protein
MQYQPGLENKHELNALHFARGCSDTRDLVAQLGEDESSQVLLPATLSCEYERPGLLQGIQGTSAEVESADRRAARVRH